LNAACASSRLSRMMKAFRQPADLRRIARQVTGVVTSTSALAVLVERGRIDRHLPVVGVLRRDPQPIFSPVAPTMTGTCAGSAAAGA
jgi:hypothetical protein